MGIVHHLAGGQQAATGRPGLRDPGSVSVDAAGYYTEWPLGDDVQSQNITLEANRRAAERVVCSLCRSPRSTRGWDDVKSRMM